MNHYQSSTIYSNLTFFSSLLCFACAISHRSTAVGYGAYGFGGLFNRMAGVLAWSTLAVGAGILCAAALYLKRQEGVLQAKADAALLGVEQGA